MHTSAHLSAIPTRQSTWRRSWLAVLACWTAWRHAQRRHHLARTTARALAGLSPATLRDIGMHGRVPPSGSREWVAAAGREWLSAERCAWL